MLKKFLSGFCKMSAGKNSCGPLGGCNAAGAVRVVFQRHSFLERPRATSSATKNHRLAAAGVMGFLERVDAGPRLAGSRITDGPQGIFEKFCHLSLVSDGSERWANWL